MDTDTLREITKLGDYIDYAHVTDDGTGSNLFDSDVDADKTYYPLAMILSDTSGASNSASISEVKNDDTTQTITGTFNVGADETRMVGVGSEMLVLPPVDGGENLEFQANSDGIEATVIYLTDEV